MSDARKILGLEKLTVEHLHPTAPRPAADLTEDEFPPSSSRLLEHKRQAGRGVPH